MRETRQQRRARERTEAKAAASSQPLPGTLTETNLVEGIPAGNGTMIRLATPSDTDAVADLVALTGVDLDDYTAEALRSEAMAGGLRTCLREGHRAMLEGIVRAAAQSDGDLRPMYLQSALPLVADRGGEVVGTLLAYPPVRVVHRYYTAAGPDGRTAQQKIALGGAIALSKLKAVAVAETARGQGLGGVLLRRCVQVYTQCQFLLLYGQMPPGRQLEQFYRGHGFDVKAEGEHLDLQVLFNRPGGLHADHGERLFAKWLD